MEKVLATCSISMPTKLRLLKCYVWSTLLFGCEGWTIITMRTRLEANRIVVSEAHEAWCVFCGLKLTNDAVLLKADTQRSLFKVITSRQIRFLNHVLRKYELEAIALTGKIEGKRARGRQRKMCLVWVSFVCGNRWTEVEILKLCQRRKEHKFIANGIITGQQDKKGHHGRV